MGLRYCRRADFSLCTAKKRSSHSHPVQLGGNPLAWVQTALSQLGVRRILFDRRSEPREAASGELAITWRDGSSQARHARVEMIDSSAHGVAFRGGHRLDVGHIIGIRRDDGICRAVVRNSRPSSSQFIIGAELCEAFRMPVAASLELH